MKETKITKTGLILIFSILVFSCNSISENTIEMAHPSIVLEEFIYEIENALTPECHASTIAVSNEILVSSWFGGTEEKNDDVGIWVSRKVLDVWSVPLEVVNGVQADGSRYPCWNPVLFKPINGPLYLYYKVGPNPREWWGLYMTSEDDGATWSEPINLPKEILGPIKNQPIQLSNGTILSPSSTEGESDDWKIHLELSSDNGLTWTKTSALNDAAEFGAIQPVVLNYGGGRLQLLSRTNKGIISQNWSDDDGLTWSEMTATSLPNPNSGIDGVTLEDGRQLLIYNPTDENWGDRVPLSVAISKDGLKWDKVFDLEPFTGGSKGEYSYPTVVQAVDGLIHIVYTWNRKTVKHVVLDPKKLN